jgi:hypothetical protein
MEKFQNLNFKMPVILKVDDYERQTFVHYRISLEDLNFL